MISHYFKQSKLKRKPALFLAISLFIGLMLQAACAPSSIHHSQEWVDLSIGLEWEDDCPVAKRRFLNSPDNESDACETLDSVNTLVPVKKPKLNSDGSKSQILVNSEAYLSAMTAVCCDIISQNKNPFTDSTSLYALRTSLLFYD